MTTINMSEYQEKHTVSRLVGSPAGYVGYGEGGVLTEAIRQRPYSVLLLDEVEKADIEVMNLFYQVFDKGTLSDGEGRIIDFKNTIIFLTSNIASSTIMNLCAEEYTADFDKLIEAVRPQLQSHFKPALLGRMTVIPYYPIKAAVLNEIIRSKLEKLSSRIFASQKLALAYDDEVVSMISRHCTDAESGARNVDHVMNKMLIPMISDEILQMAGVESSAKTIMVKVEDNQGVVVSFI
jgi:type VI secretion system protein VasG